MVCFFASFVARHAMGNVQQRDLVSLASHARRRNRREMTSYLKTGSGSYWLPVCCRAREAPSFRYKIRCRPNPPRQTIGLFFLRRKQNNPAPSRFLRGCFFLRYLLFWLGLTWRKNRNLSRRVDEECFIFISLLQG
jgi:hypothetical protein